MRKILALVVVLGLDADPTMSAALFDERAKKFTAGYEFLNQQKYQEARTAFEASLQQYPSRLPKVARENSAKAQSKLQDAVVAPAP
jgi:hypothetical protein